MNNQCIGFVYFVQAMPDGPVKIGWSRDNPDRRLKEIRMMSPLRIKPLGILRGWSPRREREIHLMFAPHRLHGEWFAPGQDLLDYVVKTVKPWPKRGEKFDEPSADRMRRAHEIETEELIQWALGVERIRRNANSGIEYYI